MDPYPNQRDEPQIPEALASGIGQLDRSRRPDWPEEDRVLAAVDAPRGRPWRVVGWSAGLTAAAAGLAVSAIVWFGGPPQHGASRGEGQAAAGGSPAAPASPVTMLDAYRLTLMLERRESPALAWDADADGRVTGADVDALAAAAVRLGEASS